MTVAAIHPTPELAWLDAAEDAMDIPDDQTVDPETALRALERIARHKARVAARESRLIRIVDDADIRRRHNRTEFPINGIWQTNLGAPPACGGRWRP